MIRSISRCTTTISFLGASVLGALFLSTGCAASAVDSSSSDEPVGVAESAIGEDVCLTDTHDQQSSICFTGDVSCTNSVELSPSHSNCPHAVLWDLVPGEDYSPEAPGYPSAHPASMPTDQTACEHLFSRVIGFVDDGSGTFTKIGSYRAHGKFYPASTVCSGPNNTPPCLSFPDRCSLDWSDSKLANGSKFVITEAGERWRIEAGAYTCDNGEWDCTDPKWRTNIDVSVRHDYY